ncbi:MAG: crossover junction endodeoxyribonuclease RuvC [Bacteroidota bacterium]
MLVLGLDPGTATTGYGLVRRTGNHLEHVAFGTVRTPADQPLAARLRLIYRELRSLLQTYQPDAVAVELLFFNRNVRTAMAVGQARGVALLAAADAGLTVTEYTPLQVKQAVVGYGRADKRQVQEMVRVLLAMRETPRPDDAADALAIAICHAHSCRPQREVLAP